MTGLSYLKIKIECICEEEAILPSYSGSALRGALGSELKKISCIKDYGSDCLKCEYASKCCYTYFFVNMQGSRKDMPYANKTNPGPFIIEPPGVPKRKYKTGERLRFNLILTGESTAYLPYFIISVENMLQKGIGTGKYAFRLKDIRDFYTNEVVYTDGRLNHENIRINTWNMETDNKNAAIKEIKIRFLTPFRYIFEGKVNSNLDFTVFIKNVFRRVSILSSIYCGYELNMNYSSMLDKALKITVAESKLSWYDWQRYSSKQDAKIKMGGFIGDIVFKGDITPFVKFIEIGSVIHIGKGCTMGMGKYEMKYKPPICT